MIDAAPLEKFFCLGFVRTVDGKRAPALRPSNLPGGGFPPRTTVAVEDRSIRESMRQIWASVRMAGFEIAWHNPPVLYAKHPWIDGSTHPGTILADREVSKVATGLFHHQRYSSSAAYFTVDVSPGPAPVETLTIDSIVHHTVGVQVGHVLSIANWAKTGSWREIQSVAPNPQLDEVRLRFVQDLQILP